MTAVIWVLVVLVSVSYAGPIGQHRTLTLATQERNSPKLTDISAENDIFSSFPIHGDEEVGLSKEWTGALEEMSVEMNGDVFNTNIVEVDEEHWKTKRDASREHSETKNGDEDAELEAGAIPESEADEQGEHVEEEEEHVGEEGGRVVEEEEHVGEKEGRVGEEEEHLGEKEEHTGEEEEHVLEKRDVEYDDLDEDEEYETTPLVPEVVDGDEE